MRILVADDDATTRLLITTQLERLGHTVLEVETGDDALDALRSDRFDAAILDWDMPGADGIDVTRHIRQAAAAAGPGAGSYTYVIMVTGAHGEESYMTAMEGGVDDFLTKPVLPALLAARVNVAARIQGMRQQVAQYEQLLPVCAHCKRIHEGDAWIPMDRYLARRTQSMLSHGICPDCAREHFPDLAK